MIYTKTKLKNDKVLCNPITVTNTYTRCAKCGKEIPLDLRELIITKVGDPFDPEVNCAKCTIKMMHKANINIDTVIRLSTVLNDIGYRMELYKLCADYEIEDVRELVPEEYETFIDALIDKVSEVRHDR